MRDLPKGLKIDRGYVQVYIFHNGIAYRKNFGKDSPLAREVASIHLAEKRKEILMGRVGITPPIPRKRFKDVCELWFPLWCGEIDGDGKPIHNEESIYERRRTLDKELIPAFGPLWFDEVTPRKVNDWREAILRSGRMSGTSVNRYQGALSAVFTDAIELIKAEKVPAFQHPAESPCVAATWAQNKIRTRIPDEYELAKLRNAFVTLNDNDGWEICSLALRSVLSMADLRALEKADSIDTTRTKTGVAIHLPVEVRVLLNWAKWRSRWERARAAAGLDDVQFRDLRKVGINHVAGRHDIKLVSQFAAHASVKTTEAVYTQVIHAKLKPLADDLDAWVKSIGQ